MTPQPSEPRTRAVQVLARRWREANQLLVGPSTSRDPEALYASNLLAGLEKDGYILIEAEAAEDAVDHHILSEAAKRNAGKDWRAISTPLEAAASDPVASPPTKAASMDCIFCKADAFLEAGTWECDFGHRYPYLAEAVASPAPLDVERLARAIHSVGKKWYRESGEIEDRHIEGNSDQLAAAIAAEYARLEGQLVAEEPA